MNFKELINKISYYISVPKCVCCGEIIDIDDRALCKTCLAQYNSIKEKTCSVCKNPYYKCLCVNDYLDKRYIHKLVKVFRYKSCVDDEKIPSNELIYNIKRGYRRDLVEFIADEVTKAIKDSKLNLKNYVITSVPRSLSRKAKYGIDHSAKLSVEIAKRLDIQYIRPLKSKSKRAQKKTHGEERFLNAVFDYRFDYDLSNFNVIIFDDIVTNH